MRFDDHLTKPVPGYDAKTYRKSSSTKASKRIGSSQSTGSTILKLVIVALILLLFFTMSSCTMVMFALSGRDLSRGNGNVAVIPITGVITSQGNDWDGTSADDAIALLEEARDDQKINAVILEINSPGGSPVASDEIGTAVKSIRAEGKPVVAWVREVGASGGYWVASTADYIVANRMSITGSIGVTGSYFGFERFIEHWNITYRQFTSGDMKEVGNPFLPEEASDRVFLQEKIDAIHEIFVDEVALNRNLSRTTVSKLATGEYYLGTEALELGLIDELGGFDEAIAYVENATGETAEPVWYEPELSLIDALAQLRATPQIPESKIELR